MLVLLHAAPVRAPDRHFALCALDCDWLIPWFAAFLPPWANASEIEDPIVKEEKPDDIKKVVNIRTTMTAVTFNVFLIVNNNSYYFVVYIRSKLRIILYAILCFFVFTIKTLTNNDIINDSTKQQ